jgi:hypothetical protein
MSKKLVAICMSLVMLMTLIPVEQASASSTADNIVSTARDYIGTPYRYGGTTPSGFDCSGYMQYVFNKEGISLPRTTAQQARIGTSVNKSELQKGDLVFFDINGSGISHAGIYIGNDNFIHASSSRGVAMASVNDPHYWKDRYHSARRVIEPEVTKEALEELPAGQYHDVRSNFWARTEIKRVGEQGYITGYEGSIFKPNNDVTRAQVAIILSRTLDLKPTGNTGDFNDVNKNFHAYDEVMAVADAGLFNGNSSGNFNPNEPFTREHLAVVFSRAFDLPNADQETVFKDVDPSRQSYSSIQRLAASGITTGYEDQTFRPGNTTTRAQLAVFLDNAIN